MFGFCLKPQRSPGGSGRVGRARGGVSVRVAAVLAVGMFLSVVGPSGAARAAKKSVSKCDAVGGWSAVAGRPAGLTRLSVGGLYLWNEKGVWRISVTHGDRKLQKFQGTISFDAPITTRPVGVEGTFADVVQTNGSTATFAFANYGGVDGIAVNAPCATAVTLSGTIDGQPVAASQVFLGTSGTNPPSVPVVLTKSTSAPQPLSGTTSAVPPSAAVAKECANVVWSTWLQGRPAVLRNNGRGATQGMYLWAEKSVLRAVLVGETGKLVQVDGTLTANAEVRVSPVGLEGKRDALKAEGTVASFSFSSGGNLDGFDLISPCATQVVIEATMNDGPITLFLGPSATAVPALPYLLTR